MQHVVAVQQGVPDGSGKNEVEYCNDVPVITHINANRRGSVNAKRRV